MPPQTSKVLDTRDGRWYKTVLMPDGKWWLAENLAWAGGGWGGGLYGRYYDWLEASGVALIAGTHLPTRAEWQAIGPSAPPLKSMLWTAAPAGTDATGFGLLPDGTRAMNGTIGLQGADAYLWTGTLQNSDNAHVAWMPDGSTILTTGSSQYYDGVGMSVRLIVDSGNVPDTYLPQLFGADFQGFERGYSVKINNHVEWVDTHGGTARGIPIAPAIYDEWEVDAEFWVTGEQAQTIEAAVPPYGVPLSETIKLPYRAGEATFAGLMPYATDGTSEDVYALPEVRSFSSMGRKGVRLDLYGYRITFALRCFQAGATTNPQTSAPTTTVPAWLQRKFASHQVQDWAVQSVATFGASLGASASYLPVRHGRRRDININLDHLSQAQADQLVQFFRGVRHNAVTLNVDNGPDGIQAVSVRLKGLSLQRGAGLWWDGTLEMCLA